MSKGETETSKENKSRLLGASQFTVRVRDAVRVKVGARARAAPMPQLVHELMAEAEAYLPGITSD